MATQVQQRRGSTAEHATFTGAVGEVTVDTDKDTAVVHDGTTAGGRPLMLESGSNSALALGSAGTPSLKFTGDPNTGIYSPGADQVAISTNGTGRLFISSTGLVGIGATPGNQLAVKGAATAGETIVASVWQTDTTANSSASIFLSSAGDSGGARGTKISAITTGNAAGNGHSLSFSTSANSAAPTERMRLTAAGLLGLGTSSPSTLLHLASVTAPTLTINRTATSVFGGEEYGSISFVGNDSSSGASGERSHYKVLSTGPNGESAIQLGTAHSNTAVQARLYITSTGSVGIGTTSPSARLDVSNIGGNVTGSDFKVDTTNGSATVTVGRLSSTASDHTKFLVTDRTGNMQFESYSGVTRFGSGASEAARFESGRLLIGTSSGRDNFFGAAPGVAPRLQLEGADTSTSTLSITRNSNDADGPTVLLGRSRGTGNTVVQSGDRIGRIQFQGNDATSFVPAAVIESFVDGTPGANSMPGRIVLSTTSSGASSPTERMRITSAGRISYNSSTSAHDALFNGALGSNTGWAFGPNATNAFVVYDVNGTGVYLNAGNTSWTGISDERLKTDLKPIENGLSKIESLRAVTGRFKTDDEGVSRSFLIAQDVQAVLPEAVDAADEERLGLRYQEVIPLLVAALKESKERIETLEADVAALKAS